MFHYVPLHFVASATFLVGFLGGITWGHVFFENLHWCTHVPGTPFDRAIGALKNVPVLWRIWRAREGLKAHHRTHHEVVEWDFGFSSRLPDKLGKTFRPAPKDFSEYEKFE